MVCAYVRVCAYVCACVYVCVTDMYRIHGVLSNKYDFAGLSPTSGQFLDGFASLARNPSDPDSLAHSSSIPVRPTLEADLEGYDRSMGEIRGQKKGQIFCITYM